MASIYKEISIDVDSSRVWESVRDIGNVHIWLVPGYAAKTHIDGDKRILTMSNGNIVKELIFAIDDDQLRLAYSVQDTQMAITHHHASFQVFPKGEYSLFPAKPGFREYSKGTDTLYHRLNRKFSSLRQKRRYLPAYNIEVPSKKTNVFMVPDSTIDFKISFPNVARSMRKNPVHCAGESIHSKSIHIPGGR